MAPSSPQGGKRRSGPKSRTSDFLGVTQYKRTGRWEAHLWDSAESEGRKGRQLHLGSFPEAVPAAVAYDRAAYKLRGPRSALNFPEADYSVDSFIQAHGHLEKNDFVYQLRLWAQSAKLAKEYGLPEPAAGIAHPVRTRKRAAGLEPASRRQRTRLPEAAGAPEQADDVVYIGTSSTEGERPQIRRSLRVRRARPMYVEGSDSDPEPEAPELPSRSGSQPPAPAMAKQGYLPSGTAPAPTPDACAFLDVTPGPENDASLFSPRMVHVRNDKLEWEASGTPSVDLHFVTGVSLLNCRPPAAEFQAEPWRDAEPSPPSTLDIADWPDLPPLQAISTPRKASLGQLPVAGYPTSIEKPLGVAGAGTAPPSSSAGSQLNDLDLSFLEELSPLRSWRSPRPSRLSRSRGLSPAQGIHSLAHAFEQGHQVPLSPVELARTKRQY